MKKLIFAAVAALGLWGAEAKAADPSYEIGYSTYGVEGVYVTTGTRVNLATLSRPSGWTATPAGYRVMNQDSTYNIFCGGPSVAASGISGRGVKITPGASVVFHLGKDYRRAGALVDLYCISESGATATALPVASVEWFGY